MAGFYTSFKEFQNYYCNKFGRQNPLPWQDGMQAVIWWITENLPENTRATIAISDDPTGVVISGKGTDTDPYIWAFNFNSTAVKGPKGDTGEQGPKGDTGEQGPQGPAGQDGTIVVANPAETGATDLTKLKVGDTVFNIPSGGGGALYLHTVNISSRSPYYTAYILIINDNNTLINNYSLLYNNTPQVVYGTLQVESYICPLVYWVQDTSTEVLYIFFTGNDTDGRTFIGAPITDTIVQL